jgi:hypothetical protein
MTRILLVWEDAKFEPLGEVVQRAVQASAPSSPEEFPRLLSHTTHGNGNFGRYVATTWPRASAHGLPNQPGMIEHVICVVDADRLDTLVPTIPSFPTIVAEIAAWHAGAAQTWLQWLRDRVDPGGPPPSTVHGIVLRWAKESLVLAGYDQPAWNEHLELDAGHPDIRRALGSCEPRLHVTEDSVFTDTFRRPLDCIKALRRARHLSSLPKTAPQIDYALRALARDSIATICARVPDIARLASLIWDLQEKKTPSKTSPATTSPLSTSVKRATSRSTATAQRK